MPHRTIQRPRDAIMRLIVIRHFKTVNNLERRIIGWGDSPPAKNWQDDLIATDQTLREHGLQFHAIYSSSLGRAHGTAQWFAARNQGLEVRTHADLNEVDYGAFSRLPKQWVTDYCPKYKTDPDYVFPCGESFTAMRRRSLRYIRLLERHHAGHTLLVVIHAGVIRGLVSGLLGLPYAPNLQRKISHRYIGDFMLEGGRATRYDELGQPSGFVRDAVIEIPFQTPDRGGAHHPLDPSDALPNTGRSILYRG